MDGTQTAVGNAATATATEKGGLFHPNILNYANVG